MPDRYLRAGILDSDKVNRLSSAEEVFYRRLMSVVDDFGRCDARNSILRAHLYPIKLDSVTERDVGKWKLATAEAGLVTLYQVDGKEFLQLLNFKQRIRAEKSKFPAPPSSAGGCPQSADSRTLLSNSRPNANAQFEVEDKTKGAAAPRFVPPTVAEVQAYCRERKNSVDAEAFVAFYAAKGWMIGKNKMKDWKQSVITWERNRGAGTRASGIVAGPGQSYVGDSGKATDDRW